MRKGPHPLSVHIGMAASEMARLGTETTAANLAQYQSNFAKMLQGIQKYQRYDKDISSPALEAVWGAGQVRLYRLAQSSINETAEPVILLPSLVNRAGILNLIEGRSMMQYFAQQGLRPFLIDWGESRKDDGQATCEDIIAQRIVPALNFIEEACGKKPHALGYCMGGTLLAATLALNPGRVASAIFLATPWDFHAGGQALQKRVEFWYPSALQALQTKNYLDQDWLQTIFASLDPLLTRDKFIKFADMEEGAFEQQLFVAIEDWLNDGVDLPYAVAQTCIQDWFFVNKPVQRQWQIGTQYVDVGAIKAPALIVASRQDRLVEFDSAIALYNQLDQAQQIAPDCGHIGMIAGRNAIASAWQPMVDFMRQ